MWFLIFVLFATTLLGFSWVKEAPKHKEDAEKGERVLYKRRWASVYIDGSCIQGMMTLEFRETYIRIYQSFSHRIIFRALYEHIKRVEKKRVWLESYTVETMSGDFCEIGLYRRDAKALSRILETTEYQTQSSGDNSQSKR